MSASLLTLLVLPAIYATFGPRTRVSETPVPPLELS